MLLNVMAGLLLLAGSIIVFRMLKDMEEETSVSEECLKRLKSYPSNTPPFSPRFNEKSSKVKHV